MKISKEDLLKRLTTNFPQIISIEGGTAIRCKEDSKNSRPACLMIRSQMEYEGLVFRFRSIRVESDSDSYLPYTDEILYKTIKDFPIKYEEKANNLKSWAESPEGQKTIAHMKYAYKKNINPKYVDNTWEKTLNQLSISGIHNS
jgi:hypothetical protein